MGDIAFLLLIFFMVTTIFREESGLPVELPRAEAGEEVNRELVSNIYINRVGQISIDDRLVQIKHITDIIGTKISDNPQLIVAFKTDTYADYGMVSDVMEELKEVNAVRVFFNNDIEGTAGPEVLGASCPAYRSTERPSSMSANDEFKAQYNKYLRWSALVADPAGPHRVPCLARPTCPTPTSCARKSSKWWTSRIRKSSILPPPPVEAPAAAQGDRGRSRRRGDRGRGDRRHPDGSRHGHQQHHGRLRPGWRRGFRGLLRATPRSPICAKPEYPEMARRAQIEGTVIVKVLVGPDGNVKDAQVIQGVNPAAEQRGPGRGPQVQVHPGQAAQHPGEGLDGACRSTSGCTDRSRDFRRTFSDRAASFQTRPFFCAAMLRQLGIYFLPWVIVRAL